MGDSSYADSSSMPDFDAFPEPKLDNIGIDVDSISYTNPMYGLSGPKGAEYIFADDNQARKMSWADRSTWLWGGAWLTGTKIIFIFADFRVAAIISVDCVLIACSLAGISIRWRDRHDMGWIEGSARCRARSAVEAAIKRLPQRCRPKGWPHGQRPRRVGAPLLGRRDGHCGREAEAGWSQHRRWHHHGASHLLEWRYDFFDSSSYSFFLLPLHHRSTPAISICATWVDIM